MKNNLPIPNRGEVWMVDLDPIIGHEQAKKRPCIVISTNSYNSGRAQLIVAVPLTSRNRSLDWFIPIKPPEGGLRKESYAISNQLRSVSINRFLGTCIGMVNQNSLLAIEKRIKILLEIYS